MASRVLLAAEQGNREAMTTYITNKQVNVVDEEGSTPLMVAAANGRDDIIRLLLEQECLKTNELDKEEERYIDRKNNYGWTALMQAAINSHLNTVLLLLQHGAKVDVQNCWGATALVVASQGGYYGVVHTLVNHGANVNLGGTEEVSTLTPLMAASQNGHLDIVRVLLQAGASTDVKLKSTGWTALMLATLNNQSSIVELLIQHGAKLDTCDVNGKNADRLASMLSHQDVLSLLAGEKLKKVSVNEFLDAVKSGNVNRVRDILHRQKSLACAKDKEGATPLMYAANKGHIEVCEVLLKNGAEMNEADKKYGWTAVMLAIQNKRYEIVKLLGQWGADFSIRGKSGSMAKDICDRNGDIEMMRLVSNIERQQQRNAPPTATPTRSDSREQPFLTQNEILKRIQTAYSHKLPTPTINVDISEDTPGGEATPTTPHFNLPGGRMSRLPPSPTSTNAPVRIGASPSSLASSSSSDQTVSESSISSAHEPTVRPLFPPGPSSRSSLLLTDKTGLTRPASGSNLFVHGGRGPRKSVPTILSKSNPGKPGNKPLNLPLKNDLGGKLSAHPLVSPQSSSRFQQVGNAAGSPLFPHGAGGAGAGGRLGGNLISSRLKEKRGSASSSGSSTSSRQTSLDVQPVGNATKNLRKRSKTEPTSSFLRGSGKGVLKYKSLSSGIDLKQTLEDASLGHHYHVFEKHQVDYQIFITMNDKDLAEVGILDSSERTQLLTLIHKLTSSRKGTANGNSSTPRQAVFVFQ